MKKKLELIAVGLGWVYISLLLAMSIRAVFAPRHELLVQFNRYHELWVDVGFFFLAFGLLTWLLILKVKGYRRRSTLGGSNPVPMI